MNTDTAPRLDAITRAIAASGGRSALMRKLNERGWSITSPSVILQWEANGTPAKYCPDIEQITGITCEALCPDVRWGLVRDRRTTKRKSKAA